METILNKHAQIIATKDVMILKRHGWTQMGSHTNKLIAVAQEMILFTGKNHNRISDVSTLIEYSLRSLLNDISGGEKIEVGVIKPLLSFSIL